MKAATLPRVAAAVAVVGATAWICAVVDADVTVTSLALVVAVVAASLLGAPAAAAGAVTGGVALTLHIEPSGRLAVTGTDRAVALLTFVVSATVVGVTTARLRDLRRRALRNEAEARVRLDVAERLRERRAVPDVAATTAARVAALFDLVASRISAPGVEAVAGDGGAGAAPIVGRSGDVLVALTPRHQPDDAGDRATLAALAAGLATAFDRARLEEEAEAARVAAAVGEGRAAFLSAVTHDLRTPLASIRAATSTLRDAGGALDAAARDDLLATAGSEAQRLERLVTKVLELTRIRSGALSPERQPWGVEELAQIAVRSLRPLLDGHTVDLQVEADDDVAAVDPAMMQHVFQNLLENALRHSPPGAPVEVRVTRSARDIEVRVVDHGPGVPMGERERVFTAFERGASAHGPGSGLGLAIVRGFVTAHDGRVWYEETPAGGATFAFSLPAAT